MGIKAKLTTFDTAMLVVSLVIGIGIFRTPAMVASATRTPFLFFCAWGLGAVISLAGALTFAEIGARFPHPGSYYKVLAECTRPGLAFMFNWTNIFVINGASAAGVAVIGAEHVAPLILPPALQGRRTTLVIAALLIASMLLINGLGIRSGARAQNLLSLLKIAMIVLLVGAAFLFRGAPSRPSAPPPVLGEAIPALWLGFISVFYSYGGYQNTINFGADVRNAKKNLPRGILFGMLTVALLYLLVNLAYTRVLGFQGVAGAKQVAAEAARVLFGEGGHTLVSLAIFLSALGFLNATLMQIPRALYAMAEDRILPPIFMKVNPKTQAQGFALFFFAGTMLLSLLLLGTFEKIVSYVIFLDSLSIACVASTIFVLRHRQRGTDVDAGLSFRIPFYPLLPALFVGFLATLSIKVFLVARHSAFMGIIIFLTGLPLYLILRTFGWKPKGID